MNENLNRSLIRAAGMAWCRPEDYDACLRIMADSNQLSASFHVWLTKAEHREKELRSEGHTIVRVYIDPETFPDWCRTRSLNIDSKARMQYAALIAKEHAGNTH